MLTKIYEQNPSERELQKVVDVLVHDGIVIYRPTASMLSAVRSIRPRPSNACGG